MSTTRFRNIGPSISDNITTNFLVHGAIKCWTAINGTGTIAIRDSFNTTSITDNGVGKYQTNITSLMKNVSYFSSGTACYSVIEATELANYGVPLFSGGNIDNARTTGICRYGGYETSSYVDILQAGVFILGDLA
jgi:hypothetical protein